MDGSHSATHAARPVRGVRPTRSRLARIGTYFLDGPGFPYLMSVPALAILGLIIGVPLVQAFLLSLQNLILTRANRPVVWGFHNYTEMIGDPEVWNAILRSSIYMIGTVTGATVMGGAAALLTRRALRGLGLARLLFILPWSIPAVAAALVWGVMYDVNFGVFNRLLGTVLPWMGNVEWLLDRNTALGSLIAIQAWNEFPVAYLFILAGLQTINDDLYEAARIDGAGRLQQFWYITLPSIRYVAAVTAMLLSIFAFKSFAIIFVLTGGGPADRTETLIIKTYNEAFRAYDFSKASALSILSLLVCAVLVFIYVRLALRQGNSGASE